VSPTQVVGTFMGVNVKTEKASIVDRFTLDLVHHTVANH
jgi:hypothetical protein